MILFKTDSISEAVTKVNDCLCHGVEVVVVYSGSTPCVLRGRAPMYRREICRELGIPVGRSVYVGGVIVCGPGDLSVCALTHHKSEFGPVAVQALARLYETKSGSVTMDGNDVLADGKKVTSWSRTHYGGMWQSVLHVSIHTDLDLIQTICTKPMLKVPGALSDYGITAEECWQALAPALSTLHLEGG